MTNGLGFARTAGDAAAASLGDLRWPDDPAEIPDWIYTDQRIYEREQERVFKGPTWNYVALEVELPEPGNYIRSYIGATPILVVRDQDGEVRVFENRCAHRGAEFCKTYRGTATEFICPYHQWTYDLSGSLIAVPFKRGVNGRGGLPKEFDYGAHNLRRLNVACRHGAVFASFRHDIESFEDYLGPMMLDQYDTVFDGRPLRLLGVHRNVLPNNWKLYQENLKDPYHATLLHTYFTTFGLFVAGNKIVLMTDDAGRHAALCNARPEKRPDMNENTSEIRSFKETMKLADPRVLEFVKEKDSPWSSNAITIWPNLILLRQMNILGVRQIVPMGPDQMMLIWTTFGYADDSEDMVQHRLRQNNLFGPGGFVGVDDNEALKFVQDGLRRSAPRHGVAPLGHDDEDVEVVITDRAIRKMYAHYRTEMDIR